MSMGSFPAKKMTGWNIFPGWILIKKSDDIEVENADYVHGKLTLSYFGLTPYELKDNYGARIQGFSIRKGFNYTFKSSSMNFEAYDSDSAKHSSRIKVVCERAKN